MSDSGNVDNTAVTTTSSAQNKKLRRRLFVVVPAVAVLIAAYVFLFGGRYVSTDNAYVKADVVNVSSEITGNILDVAVVENQRVKAGQVLLRVDAQAYEVGVHDAQAELEQAYIRIKSLKAAYVQKGAALAAAQDDLAYARKQQHRMVDLQKKGVASNQQLDQAQRDLDVALNTVSRLESDRSETLAQLGGQVNVDIQRHPEVQAAQAALEKARLDLARCTVRSPVDGVASKVPHIGQYAMPGLPVVSVVADSHIWIEANFKEDQLAKLKPGAEVKVEIDAYPGEEWTASVESIAQATGAEFALLPPQNATGNWVKIVQRLPVRLSLDHHRDESTLRSGLSAEVTVDTGVPARLQALSALFGDKKVSTSKQNGGSPLIAGQL